MSANECHQCHRTIPLLSKYCMYCGTHLESINHTATVSDDILLDVDLLDVTSQNIQRLHAILDRFKEAALLTDDVLNLECTIEEVHYVMLKYLIRSYLSAAYGMTDSTEHHEVMSQQDSKLLTQQLRQIFHKEDNGEYTIALEHYLMNEHCKLREPDLLTWLQLQLYYRNNIPVFTNTWTLTEIKEPPHTFHGFGDNSGDIPF